MIGKAEEEGDDETLQTDQDNGEQLIETIQLSASIRSIGQQEVL